MLPPTTKLGLESIRDPICVFCNHPIVKLSIFGKKYRELYCHNNLTAQEKFGKRLKGQKRRMNIWGHKLHYQQVYAFK